MSRGLWASATLLLVSTEAVTWAQTAEEESVPALLRNGRTALERGEFSEARRIFIEGLKQDLAARGELELDYRFYLGLTLSHLAEAEEVDGPGALLAEAAIQYERALELDPRAGGVLNNLAEVYTDLGRTAEAEQMFSRAAVVESDPLRPFYRRNFADFLVERGDWRRAVTLYRQTLDEEPADRQAHESLLSLLQRAAPENVPDYLAFVLAKGQAGWVEEAASDAATATKDSQQARSYLLLLAASLAEQVYSPEEFAERPAGRAVRQLASRAGVGQGAQELLDLHMPAQLAPEAYRWWAEHEARAAGGLTLTRSLSPLQVFRRLARSLAEYRSGQGRHEDAARYLELSVYLSDREPDLEAVQGLAALAAETTDLTELNRAVDWSEAALRRAGRARPEALYLYRHDLGLLYTWLGQWKNSSAPPTSSIFQLRRATALAADVAPEDGAIEAPEFDARIYSYLARGYVEIGEREQAHAAWTELIEAYEAQGLTDEADALAAVFRPRRRRAEPTPRSGPLDDPLLPRSPETEPPKPPAPPGS